MGILGKLFGSSGNSKEEKAEDHSKKSGEHFHSDDFESGINELNKAIELNPTSRSIFWNSRKKIKKTKNDKK